MCDDELMEAYEDGFEKGKGRDRGFFGGVRLSEDAKKRAFKRGVKDGQAELDHDLDSLIDNDDEN